jgi:hypothetical protein
MTDKIVCSQSTLVSQSKKVGMLADLATLRSLDLFSEAMVPVVFRATEAAQFSLVHSVASQEEFRTLVIHVESMAVFEPIPVFHPESMAVFESIPVFHPESMAVFEPFPASHPESMAVPEPFPASHPESMAVPEPFPASHPESMAVSEPFPASHPESMAVSEPFPVFQLRRPTNPHEKF